MPELMLVLADAGDLEYERKNADVCLHNLNEISEIIKSVGRSVGEFSFFILVFIRRFERCRIDLSLGPMSVCVSASDISRRSAVARCHAVCDNTLSICYD